MPITISEAWGSPDFESSEQGKSVSRTYIVSGTDDASAANDAVAAGAPGTLYGAALKTIRSTRIGHNEWASEVTYTTKESRSVGDIKVSFDTTGGTQHVRQSLATTGYHGSGTFDFTPDFKGAIGVTKNGVDGVDIVVPSLSRQETHYFAVADVDDTYINAIADLTGKVNNATFRGRAAGEVLFLGASGQNIDSEKAEITFRFGISPNATGLSIGDITGIAKKGWEYLWVRYEDHVDESNEALVKRAVNVYVERVYDNGDFSLLGI